MPEPECSRKHCEITFRDGNWTIRDYDSRNGTFVNDQPISGSFVLRSGDVIRIALVKMQFMVVHSGDTASSVPAMTDDAPSDSATRTVTAASLNGPSDSGYWSPSTRAAMVPLLGNSLATQELREQIDRMAQLTAPILIQGPSGVGKGVVAAQIHGAAGHSPARFTHWDCNGLSSNTSLAESTRITSLVVPNAEGSVFLDEVSVLTPADQGYVLSLILQLETRAEDTAIRPVRVLASSSIDLAAAVEAGKFRRDLYFRLCVLTLSIKPLRERKEDIIPLADYFREQYARRLGRAIEGLTPAAVAALESHSWPGNVRELENTIYRAVALCGSSTIDAADLHLTVKATGERATLISPPYQGRSLEDVELAHILATLNATDWNKTRSSQILGIERSTLDRKLKRYGLNRPPTHRGNGGGASLTDSSVPDS